MGRSFAAALIRSVLELALLVQHCEGRTREQCCMRVDPVTRQIVDAHGRARIFHGVNVVYKSPPYYPSNGSFDPNRSLNDEDVQLMVDSGFNVVRLYVAWPGVEPHKNQYNHTYLQVLSDIVSKLGEAGIYTILDCHQDLLSPKFCGEGVPDYAALYMNRSTKPLPFPLPYPQLEPFTVGPNGYPARNDCLKHPFFSYYFSDADAKAWQSLFDDEQGVQGRFALFWEKVADWFSGNPYVLGYELLNEPWVGDFYRHPDQLYPDVADKKNLQPMYHRLHSTIRASDSHHIVFFEPTVFITQLPLKRFSATGLTEGPGGREFNDRQILSFHMYCFLLDKHGQPASTPLCDMLDTDVLDIRISDMQKLGVAGFMTEWGAYTALHSSSRSWKDAQELVGLADDHLLSWAYWQYKGYGGSEEGLWFRNGTLQQDKLFVLSRTYAQAVTGRYVNQSFDPTSRNFSLSFAVDTDVHAPTVIFLNEALHYPMGYSVSVTPPEAVIITKSRNFVTLSMTKAVKNGEVVTVEILPDAPF